MRRSATSLLAVVVLSVVVTACEMAGTHPLARELGEWYQPTLRIQIKPEGAALGPLIGPGSAIDLGALPTNVGGAFQFYLSNAGSGVLDQLSIESITATNETVGTNVVFQAFNLLDAESHELDDYPAARANGVFSVYPANGVAVTLTIAVVSNDPTSPTSVFTLNVVGDASLNVPDVPSVGGAGGAKLELQYFTVAGLGSRQFAFDSSVEQPIIVAALGNGESETVTLRLKNTGDSLLLLANQGALPVFDVSPSEVTMGAFPESLEVDAVFDLELTYENPIDSTEDDPVGGPSDYVTVGVSTWAVYDPNFFGVRVRRTASGPSPQAVIFADGFHYADSNIETLGFGGVAATGGTKLLDVEVLNTGAAALVINGVSVTVGGADYGVTTTNPTLQPGESEVYTVTFDPTATGLRSGTLTIDFDPSYGTDFDVEMEGTGI